MLETPIYLITGFLESGKTSFIRDVLDSPDFADGARTLLLLCEEGEEEYDEARLKRRGIEIVRVEKEEDLTTAFLEQCGKKYRPARVFVEFNGMWDAKKFGEMKLPRRWEIVQVITLVDGSTFEMYLANMRSILSNIFAYTEMVIFNRCSLDMDLQKFRRTVKAVNQGAMLGFEDEMGRQLDIGTAQPPYDLSADVIQIDDQDFGLWYLDLADSPERYKNRTVQFLGKVMIPRQFPKDCFIPGRNAMTCCENDIRFIGYICRAKGMALPAQKQWVKITAKVSYEYMAEYRGEGPVLVAQKIEPAQAPQTDLVYFN